MKRSTVGIGSRDKWYTGQRYKTVNCGDRESRQVVHRAAVWNNQLWDWELTQVVHMAMIWNDQLWDKWYTGQWYETINSGDRESRQVVHRAAVWNNQLWGLGVDTSGTQGNGMKRSTVGIGSRDKWYTGQWYETINSGDWELTQVVHMALVWNNQLWGLGVDTSGTQGNGMKRSTVRQVVHRAMVWNDQLWGLGVDTSGTQGNGMKQSTVK